MRYVGIFIPGRRVKAWLIIMWLGLCLAQPAGAGEPPILYLFWGEGCPHCEREKTFLDEFRQQYPQVELRLFETWQHPEFAQLADAVRQAHQIKGAGVPLTVMGDWYLVGFNLSGNYRQQMITQAETCLQQGCPDALDKIGPSALASRIRAEAAANVPNGWQQYPAAIQAAPTKIIVSYFHGAEDCPVCVQVEQVTRQAVETRFQRELQHGRIEFRTINVETPENQPLIETYQLTARAVVIADVVQGRETRWKKLDNVWALLGDDQALTDYVQAEITIYLQEH